MKTKTEQRNPRSRGLDRKSTLEILRILNHEDARVARPFAASCRKSRARSTRSSKHFEAAGALFYVGAGTSGRMAVLDAAECPPTFGTPPSMVQAIIAGGARALHDAVEGAEDSTANGAQDLRRARISRRDVVVGIPPAAPRPTFSARSIRAKPRRGHRRRHLESAIRRWRGAHDIAIAPETGPEAVAGSTRMKAGTAQKMVLNLLSTAAMVRMGRVYENWMVHVALTNHKLRHRGARILEEAAGVSASTAEHALRQADTICRRHW